MHRYCNGRTDSGTMVILTRRFGSRNPYKINKITPACVVMFISILRVPKRILK